MVVRCWDDNWQLLGAGLRAGSLRSRVLKKLKKFIGWLAAPYDLAYPENYLPLFDHMRVRLSKPCVRGPLKLVHATFVFMGKVAGVRRMCDNI